jgi:WD40 repeat protein
MTLRFGEYVRRLVPRKGGADWVAALGDGRLVWVEARKGFAPVVRHEWQAHQGGVLAAEWSPDGRRLATTGEDGWVRWWEAAGAPAGAVRLEGGWGESLGWSRDGQWLAVAAGKRVRFFAPDGSEAGSSADGSGAVAALAWAGSGHVIAAASYGQVRFLRPGVEAPVDELRWKAAYVSMAWSPDRRHLAAGTQESSIIYWPLPFRDEEPLHMSGYSRKVKCLAWDGNSRWLATGGGPVVTVWDVSGAGPAGRRPLQLEGHEGSVSALAFAPRGGILASGADDGSLLLWNPAAGESGVPAGGFSASVTALAWAPEGGLLAAGSGEGEVVFVG